MKTIIEIIFQDVFETITSKLIKLVMLFLIFTWFRDYALDSSFFLDNQIVELPYAIKKLEVVIFIIFAFIHLLIQRVYTIWKSK